MLGSDVTEKEQELSSLATVEVQRCSSSEH